MIRGVGSVARQHSKLIDWSARGLHGGCLRTGRGVRGRQLKNDGNFDGGVAVACYEWLANTKSK